VERLQKILSQAGVASRRASEQLMLEGRVTVNGTTVRELGTKADPARDDIRVDGRRVRLPERHLYLLLNKPRGYVTTRSDPQKRPTVLDLVAVREYVYPVGRLDFDSEGLLLLTNDGDLAARLTHPRHGVKRVYEARVLGVPDQHDLQRLSRGIVIEGRRTEPADVKLLDAPGHPSARVYARAQRLRPKASGGAVPASREKGLPARGGGALRAVNKATLHITIREGRNRQVRKMFEAIGHPVDSLRRVAIGPINDPRLKVGQWRELSREEVERLRKATAEPPQRTQRTQRENPKRS
jgi:23S rRNA pseudouridine2605 synthase